MQKIKDYNPVDESYIDEMLLCELRKNRKKIVVLDDDPTGVQTVHDVSVYTGWDKESIRKGFEEDKSLFYILTNSRGLTRRQTADIHTEIAGTVDAVAKEKKAEYLFISRSDSTLRGHYPLETQILKENYERNTGRKIDGEILCPFFKEGGRLTIENIHYVKTGETLVPANETEFAKDSTFGYLSASMPDYIEEKTKGLYKSKDVVCITLEDIRNVNIDKIKGQLLGVQDFNKIVVNAVDYTDLKIFCIALFLAMAEGKQYMFRTAASFVKIIGGIPDKALLTKTQMIKKENTCGGIIIAGSHTKKTTGQLKMLQKLDNIEFIELNAELVKDEKKLQREIDRCLRAEEECLRKGKTVCCYTSRAKVNSYTGNGEDELMLSVKISDAVQSLIGRLEVSPSFIVAKGGITSSDIGTKALKVRRADVLGQIKPGVPVWQTGGESKFPGIPYIIFPGNVGEEETLKKVVEILTDSRAECISDEGGGSMG